MASITGISNTSLTSPLRRVVFVALMGSPKTVAPGLLMAYTSVDSHFDVDNGSAGPLGRQHSRPTERQPAGKPRDARQAANLAGSSRGRNTARTAAPYHPIPMTHGMTAGVRPCHIPTRWHGTTSSPGSILRA